MSHAGDAEPDRGPACDDHDLFVRTTTESTGRLLNHTEVDEVLTDLADRLAELLALAGSGVTVGRVVIVARAVVALGLRP